MQSIETLYGIKKALRGRCGRLIKLLLNHGFKRKKLNTLLIRAKRKYLLLLQIDVNGIIFGATNHELSKEIFDLMSEEVEMSLRRIKLLPLTTSQIMQREDLRNLVKIYHGAAQEV